MGIKWGGSGVDTLYGKQFPGEQIQALWDMVDMDAGVYWCGFPAPGYFLIRLFDTAKDKILDQDEVLPEDAHDYDVWARKIQALISRNFGNIVSTHNADAMRAPPDPSDWDLDPEVEPAFVRVEPATPAVAEPAASVRLSRKQRRKNKQKTT